MEGGWSRIGKVRFLVASKLNGESSRRDRHSTVLTNYVINVRRRENRVLSDLENIPSQKLAVSSILGMRTEGTVEGRNVCTMETRATFILKSKGLRG
jgi:hypothetical protein